MRFPIVRTAVVALGALTLAGCIQSSDPVLIDSQPVFGPHLRLSYYQISKGYGHDPGEVSFDWNGALYVHKRGDMRGMPGISAFSVFPFEGGDYIIQTVPVRQPTITEYGLLRKLAPGVFLVRPIDSEDADETTRDADCARGEKGACRVVTRSQLFDFARATAARDKDTGGLVIRLPDRPQRLARPVRHSRYRRYRRR